MNNWGYYSDFEIFYKINQLEIEKKFSNKNLLITGATGLIGSALLDFFIFLKIKKELNIRLFALIRDENKLKSIFQYENEIIQCINQDVKQPIKASTNFDYIVHGASLANPRYYLEKPIETINTTIKGTENLLNLAKDNSSKMIFLSSVEVYGNIESKIQGIKENEFGHLDCNSLRSSYAESKRLAETLCNAYYHEHGTNVVIARLCKTYGPSSSKSDERVMAYLFDAVEKNIPITLQSDGSRIFSFCYATDAVSALVTLMLKGDAGEAYNISDRRSIASLKEIALYISKISGISVTFNKNSSGIGVSQDTIVDSSKLNQLGWSPIIDINTGLDRQYDLIANK